ncbi:MAG: murein biosynthesis integral membrane protein MurJ [Pseudomonadota bacterium]|jgi:putative peptidoglycan lipid II flippase
MTGLSRVAGLIRDMVLARVLGADGLADAFFVAFKLPNFLRRLFAEGAFSQAFVPVLAEYRERGSPAAVRELLDRVAGTLGSALLALTLVAVPGAPLLAWLFAPGFAADPVKFAATIELIRITFPYLLFISLAGFLGSVLNSYDRFAVPAFTPVWLNLCLIAAALLAAAQALSPAHALAWGVFAAGTIQLLFQMPFLARLHLLPRPRPGWRHPGVRRVLGLMAPALFGVSVSQINLLLDTVIASFLPEGSVSWLYYSDRLVELPLGVFGVAAATVILPRLSRLHSGAAPAEFRATLDWGLRFVLLIAVPATVALVLLAGPLLTALFYDGASIGRRDIDMAGHSLRAFALGLIAFMCIKVLASGFYARQDTRTPVAIGIAAMVANMAFNLILVWPLHHYLRLGHAGLALATALAAWLNAGLLLRSLWRAGVYRPGREWRRFAAVLAAANLAMAAALLFLLGLVGDWSALRFWPRAGALLGLCAAGLAVYLAGLWAGGVRIRDFRPRT